MIKQRTLGPYTVSAIGMGCMPLSFRHERDPLLIDEPDRAIAVIHAAMDAGITLFDTADIYAPAWNSMGHNEILLGKALATLHNRLISPDIVAIHDASGAKGISFWRER
jgi:aryl-alcohol dehydrogenase-like predicted oxidoreductase